jgi:hypothetical protein
MRAHCAPRPVTLTAGGEQFAMMYAPPLNHPHNPGAKALATYRDHVGGRDCSLTRPPTCDYQG